MTSEQVTARLATVSALRTLCLRLPHVPSPMEIVQLKRFDALVHAPEHATARDLEALVAGWSRWWREGRRGELADMAPRLDRALIDADRRLATFATAADDGQTLRDDVRFERGLRPRDPVLGGGSEERASGERRASEGGQGPPSGH